MRLSCISDDAEEKKSIQDFVECILVIGNGNTTSDDGDELIQVPSDILLEKGSDPKETIVNSTHPNMLSNYKDMTFYRKEQYFCCGSIAESYRTPTGKVNDTPTGGWHDLVCVWRVVVWLIILRRVSLVVGLVF
jgi:hypothetical protein